MALAKGLDAAIINPSSTEMMKAYHSYLAWQDWIPTAALIFFAENLTVTASTASTSVLSLVGEVAGRHHSGIGKRRGAREALATAEPPCPHQQEIVPALDENKGLKTRRCFC